MSGSDGFLLPLCFFDGVLFLRFNWSEVDGGILQKETGDLSDSSSLNLTIEIFTCCSWNRRTPLAKKEATILSLLFWKWRSNLLGTALISRSFMKKLTRKGKQGENASNFACFFLLKGFYQKQSVYIHPVQKPFFSNLFRWKQNFVFIWIILHALPTTKKYIFHALPATWRKRRFLWCLFMFHMKHKQ